MTSVLTLLFRLGRHLPLWCLHGLGSALGWVSFVLSPRYRRRLLAHAALPDVALTVVTNAPAIATLLGQHGKASVIVLGGRYNPAAGSVTGATSSTVVTLSMMRRGAGRVLFNARPPARRQVR